MTIQTLEERIAHLKSIGQFYDSRPTSMHHTYFRDVDSWTVSIWNVDTQSYFQQVFTSTIFGKDAEQTALDFYNGNYTVTEAIEIAKEGYEPTR